MLFLQDMARQGEQTSTVTLNERLPHFITSSVCLQVNYHIEANDDFYLIHLHVHGTLSIQCQRCLDEFDFPYDNMTIVAVCRTDERAEQILEQYECIVSPSLQVSLEEILIDELHLYAPQFHPEVNDCSNEVNQILIGKK
jgi:uncharacterized protein